MVSSARRERRQGRLYGRSRSAAISTWAKQSAASLRRPRLQPMPHAATQAAWSSTRGTGRVRNADIRFLDLTDANFESASLSANGVFARISLGGSEKFDEIGALTGANFEKASISTLANEAIIEFGSRFRGADSTGANFAKASLSAASNNIPHVDPRRPIQRLIYYSEARIIFALADLTGANFENASLATTADIANIDFDGKALSDANFATASLAANGSSSDITSTIRFVRANLSNANFSGAAIVADGRRADVRGAPSTARCRERSAPCERQTPTLSLPSPPQRAPGIALRI